MPILKERVKVPKLMPQQEQLAKKNASNTGKRLPPVITDAIFECYAGRHVAVTQDASRQVMADGGSRKELFAAMIKNNVDSSAVIIAFVD